MRELTIWFVGYFTGGLGMWILWKRPMDRLTKWAKNARLRPHH